MYHDFAYPSGERGRGRKKDKGVNSAIFLLKRLSEGGEKKGG